MKQVAILGTGMAGLLSAKAVLELDMQPILIDRTYDKKYPVGLHYMHDDCGMNLPMFTIHNYIIDDNPSEEPVNYKYCRKLFGEINASAENNSIKNLPQFEEVYCMRTAYNKLYDEMKQHFHWDEVNVDHETFLNIKEEYDYVVSTIPLFVTYPEHKCESEVVWTSREFPNILKNLELYQNNTVYNVNEDEEWYRASRVLGTTFTEFVSKPEGVEAFPIKKVLTAGADIEKIFNADNVLLVGRYGTWHKKELAHHAYYRTLKYLGGN